MIYRFHKQDSKNFLRLSFAVRIFILILSEIQIADSVAI
jgi:hypothetical protein